VRKQTYSYSRSASSWLKTIRSRRLRSLACTYTNVNRHKEKIPSQRSQCSIAYTFWTHKFEHLWYEYAGQTEKKKTRNIIDPFNRRDEQMRCTISYIAYAYLARGTSMLDNRLNDGLHNAKDGATEPRWFTVLNNVFRNPERPPARQTGTIECITLKYCATSLSEKSSYIISYFLHSSRSSLIQFGTMNPQSGEHQAVSVNFHKHDIIIVPEYTITGRAHTIVRPNLCYIGLERIGKILLTFASRLMPMF